MFNSIKYYIVCFYSILFLLNIKKSVIFSIQQKVYNKS